MIIALRLNKRDKELELILELIGLKSAVYKMKKIDAIYVCIPDMTFGYMGYWYDGYSTSVCKTKEDFIKEINNVL
jgi:hypothetical protein